MVDMLFPPRCLACSELTEAHGNVCADCWQTLNFISAPFCHHCGDPFPYNLKDATTCMACLQTPPPFAGARAVLHYSPASRRLIAGFKYYDRTQATPMFARWMLQAGQHLLSQADVIMPVPLHRRRLIKRRYNQSALLTAELARQSGKPVLLDGLQRTRHTPQQAGLTREQRQENVKSAFTVNPKHAIAIQGKRVLLIDDVMTTGATLHACTHALLDAGAKDVYLLTLARRVLED